MQMLATLLLTLLGLVAGSVKCWDKQRRFPITRVGLFVFGSILVLTGLNLWQQERAGELESRDREAFRQGQVRAEQEARAARDALHREQQKLSEAQHRFDEVQSQLHEAQGRLIELTQDLSKSDAEQARIAEEQRQLQQYEARLDGIASEYRRWVEGTQSFLEKQRNPPPVDPRLRGLTAKGQEPFQVYSDQAARVDVAWEEAKAALEKEGVSGSFGDADLAFRRLRPLRVTPENVRIGEAAGSLRERGEVRLDPGAIRRGASRPSAQDLQRSFEPTILPPTTEEGWMEGLEKAVNLSAEALGSAILAAKIARSNEVLGR